MVLLILGIVAAVVIPMMGKTADVQASAAARRLTSDLLYAQNYAITHQMRVQVSFDPNQKTYTLTGIPAVGSPAVLTDPLTRRAYVVSFAGASNPLSNVAISPSAAAVTFTFTSLGSPEQGGTVSLLCGEVMRNVTVEPITGKVRVE